MKENNKIRGIFEGFTSGFLFKIVYLALVLISFNTFALDVPYLKNAFVALSVALGGIVLIYRLIHFKRFIKMKYIWVLVAFLASYLLSLLLNLRYGFLEPIQAMVWMTFQYFILFLKDPARPCEKSQREFRVLSWIFCVYQFCCSAASLVLLFLNYTELNFERQPIKLAGIVWGRLWGVYTDPNYASVLSVAAIFLALYLVKCRKGVFVKIFFGINTLIQLLYVAFSDSRTGLVCLAVAGACYAYLRLVKLPKLDRKRLVRQTVSCITALCILCVLLIVPKGITYTYNKVIELTSSDITEPGETPQTSQEPPEPTIGREQDIESDVSNRRFDLWKSGLEIYRLKPIFGVSIFNAVAFAQEQLPTTYLINNDAGIFDSLHNAFLNVLMGQGIVGFVIFMIFIVLCVVLILKGYLKTKKEEYCRTNVRNAILIAVLAALGASMMFVGDIVYLNSGASFLFWNILGCLVFYYSGEEQDALA